MDCSLLGLKKSDMTEVTDFSLVMKETAPVLTCGNILPTKWKNRLKTRKSKCFLEKLRLYIRRACTMNSQGAGKIKVHSCLSLPASCCPGKQVPVLPVVGPPVPRVLSAS